MRIPHGVLANGVLLRKMPMPRQIIPLTVVLTTFFDFLMSGLVLAATLLLFGIPPTAQWLWLPLLVAMTSFLGWTVGIGITAFTIYRRDMLHGIQHIMQVWLIITPVIYGANEVTGDLQWLLFAESGSGHHRWFPPCAGLRAGAGYGLAARQYCHNLRSV